MNAQVQQLELEGLGVRVAGRVLRRPAHTAKLLREFTPVHSEKSVARKSKIVLLDPTVFAKREKKNTKLGVFRIIPYRNRRKRDLF